MATISELFVSLKLSADSFNNGLKAAAREAKEFEKNLKPTLAVTKDLGIAMAAAGGAVVAAMTAASKAAIDYGDRLNDARQRTGATVEVLSRLGFAAEQSGSSFEGLSNGLKFLARNMETAIAKTGDQRAAFNALGITSKDLSAAQGDVNKVFLLLADRFRELPDGAEKSALAMRVFGKSGQDLIPLLNEGSDGIRELGNEAAKAGLVIDQQFATASDQLNDTLNEVKAAALGASVGIATALLPAMQSIATSTAEAGQKFAAFAQAHPALIQATAALSAGLLTLGTGLATLAVIVPKVQAGIALLGGGMAVLSGAAIVALIASIAALVIAYKNWSAATDNLKKQLDEQDNSIVRASKSLKEYGVVVNLAGKSEDEQTRALAKAGKELQAKLLSTKQATTATTSHTKVIIDEAAALKASKDAIEREKNARDLATKGMRIALDMRIQEADLLPKVTRLQFEYSEALRKDGEAAVQASAELAGWNETVEAAIAGMKQAQYNAEEMEKDLESFKKSDPGTAIGVGFDKSAEAIKKNTDAARGLKDATDDIKNAAGHIFDDMFIKGESVFSSLGNALKGGILSLGRAIFEDVTAALLGPIKKAFDDFFDGLLEGIGFKRFISGIGDQIGSSISGLFGGGGAASSVGGSSGGIGGAAGGAGGGVLGGVLGGAISGIASLIGSMRLEGTMNAVEANTRFTYILIRDLIDHIMWPVKIGIDNLNDQLFNHKYLPDITESIGHMTIEAINRVESAVSATAGAIAAAVSNISIPMPTPPAPAPLPVTPMAGGGYTPPSPGAGIRGIFGAGPLPSYASGTDYVPRTGLAMLHKGEKVVPRGQTGGITININAPIIGSFDEWARSMAKHLNRLVEHGGVRLVASGVNR